MDYTNGIAPDPRSEEEKAKDYQHKDVAGAILINWIEKPPTAWKKYIPREQDGSLSCCGQASAKAIEILLGDVMSAHPPYRSRANFPDGGMYLQNIGEVWKNVGSTTELLDPSQSQNETTMNRDIAVSTPTKAGGYAFPKPKNIDEIAEAIELHGHCILIFHCSKTEWTATPFYNGATIDFGHCICAIDYFLKDGAKTLLIEDSTGHFSTLDGKGQRLITENFLNNRCDGAIYLTLEKPIVPFKFLKDLKLGMTNSDVKELQKRLGVIQTGFFGPLTFQAVKKFQSLNSLPTTGFCGPLTRAVLNK